MVSYATGFKMGCGFLGYLTPLMLVLVPVAIIIACIVRAPRQPKI